MQKGKFIISLASTCSVLALLIPTRVVYRLRCVLSRQHIPHGIRRLSLCRRGHMGVGTVLLRFPLYCPKCKKETRIDLINHKIYKSLEPDA